MKQMRTLLETLRVEHGRPLHVSYHNERFNRSRRALFSSTEVLDLQEHISVPVEMGAQTLKCRVTYGPDMLKVEFEPYRPRDISSLKLVNDDRIEYDFKYEDRKHLEALFEKRGDAGDVLIVRNGLITDTSYANVAFWNGRRWLTPRNPLLKGTCRARLLEDGVLAEADLAPVDLREFRKIRIFNALMDREANLERFIISW